MRMKAFGPKRGDAAAAQAGRSASGRESLITRPPPKAAPALRKSRRSSRGISSWSAMVGPFSARGTVDCGAEALVGAAAADIAGHGGIDVGIARLRHGGQQRCGRHDLA